MNPPNISSRSEELQGLIGSGPADMTEPIDRQFAPWHRPRKQYVRSLQWEREIRDFVRHNGTQGDTLHYLGLPGPDYMDLHHLSRGLGEEFGLTIRYFGVSTEARSTSSQYAQLSSSEFSLKRHHRISSDSMTHGGDLREIYHLKSDLSVKLKDWGTFHVVNLDLCTALSSSLNGVNYFNAIQSIVDHQLQANHSQVLFVTARFDKDAVSGEVADKFVRLSAERFGEGDPVGSAQETSGAEIDDRSQVHVAGFLAWLESRARERGFDVSVRPMFCFRTGSDWGKADMYSIAVRLKRVFRGVPDPDGLSSTVSMDQHAFSTESFATRLSEVTNVDCGMAASLSSLDRNVGDSVALLSMLGYDTNSYTDWLLQEHVKYPMVWSGFRSRDNASSRLDEGNAGP